MSNICNDCKRANDSPEYKTCSKCRARFRRVGANHRENRRLAIRKSVDAYYLKHPEKRILEKRIVAFDGEGDESGYRLLQNSDGLTLEGNPLTIRDVLPNLCLKQTDGKRNVNVWYSARYDFEMLFRNEPKTLLIDLFKKENEVWIGEYLVSVVPRKWLKIKYGHSMFYHWDVYGWFQQSFLKTIEEWGIHAFKCNHKTGICDNCIICKGKELRDRFPEDFSIKEYNFAECVALKDLMVKLIEGLTAAGYPNLRSFYGPGAGANLLLKKLHIDSAKFCDWLWERCGKDSLPFGEVLNRTQEKYGLEFSQAFKNDSLIGHPLRYDFDRRMSYFGGRIELLQRGQFDKVYNYDINSCYPTAITQLPALDWSKWVSFKKFTETDLENYNQGLVEVSWKGGEGERLGPFPFRTDGTDISNNYVIFPVRHFTGGKFFKGIYHLIEVQTAIEKAAKEGIDWDIRLGRANVIEDCNDSYPFEEIGNLLDYRMLLKSDKTHSKHAGHKPLKLILNSLYGKTAQRPKGNSTRDPRYRELFYAGYITAYGRAQLLKYTIPDSTILLCTDGVYSTEKLDCPISESWGGWEFEQGPGRFLQAGVYEFNGVNKSRGFPKLDFNKAFQHITTKNKPFSVKDRRFISIKQSLAQKIRYNRCGFYDTTKKIDWNANEKRWLWIEKQSFPNRTQQILSAPYSWEDYEDLEDKRETSPEDTYQV